MAENNADPNNLPKRSDVNSEKVTVEPVRSRWTPKPEQILILESIFNSGMVNPPKDETVRIRKLLEKFGTVGDANVFYWFQNRRSRSRRRQRQLQANLLQGGDPQATPPPPWHLHGGAVLYDPSLASQSSTSSSSNSSGGGGFIFSSSLSSSPSSSNSPPSTASMSIAVPNAVVSTCCSSGMAVDDGADDLFSISRQMGFPAIRDPLGFPTRSDLLDVKYHPGFITVFINGIPAEVPGGPFDTRAMFGSDAVLVRSSGEIVPVNEHGILFQGLEMGESYFLVPRLG